MKSQKPTYLQKFSLLKIQLALLCTPFVHQPAQKFIVLLIGIMKINYVFSFPKAGNSGSGSSIKILLFSIVRYKPSRLRSHSKKGKYWRRLCLHFLIEGGKLSPASVVLSLYISTYSSSLQFLIMITPQTFQLWLIQVDVWQKPIQLCKQLFFN